MMRMTIDSGVIIDSGVLIIVIKIILILSTVTNLMMIMGTPMRTDSLNQLVDELFMRWRRVIRNIHEGHVRLAGISA